MKTASLHFLVRSTLKPMLGVAIAAAGAAAMPAFAQGVGVSIGINQPGVYGRVDIGNYPQPALVSPQPVVIAPGPVAVQRRPIYLYVPPEHQRDWRRYCGSYNACGQPVYFVQDQWVRDRWHQEHLHDRDHRGPGWDRDHRGYVEHRDDHRDDHRPDDHRPDDRR